MKAPSWLHFYLETFRPRRTLRDHDARRNVAVVVDGCVIAGMAWRAGR